MPALITLAAALLVTPSFAQNWSTYPHVPKTASINGFADSIYAKVPACAGECLKQLESTGNTPCPYWDTGCLCIMPQFIDPIEVCVASKCSGTDVAVATSAFSSNCQRVGAWFSPAASDSTLIAEAEARTPAASASSTPAAQATTAAAAASASASPAAPQTAAASSAASSSAAAAADSAKGTKTAAVPPASTGTSSHSASQGVVMNNGANAVGVGALGAFVGAIALAL